MTTPTDDASERTTKGRLVFHNGTPDCEKCAAHMADMPHLVEACASVGIEHGKSTGEMFKQYIGGYHFGGHQ